MTTSLRTRICRLSTRKIAFLGDAYLDQFVGLPAVHTTYEGEKIAGVVERFVGDYAIIRFPDGRWARAAHMDALELVTDRAA